MPKIKVKRTDIMRQQEILNTIQKAGQIGEWLQALLALAWIFGKRISELLQLQKEDIWTEGSFLYVRFRVLKKKSRRDSGIPQPFTKRITLSHPGVQYIRQYYMNAKAGKLFNMNRHKPKYYLKKINPDAWWHLFRESLATKMAERGATEEELMHWFDWDRVDTAHDYVKRGTKLTERLSERTW